jgi:signal peptidase I
MRACATAPASRADHCRRDQVMSQHQDSASPPAPWLTVWTRPRATISGVLAEDPRRHVLRLAAAAGIAGTLTYLVDAGLGTELVAWSGAAMVTVGGVLIGIVALYLNALLLRWSALLFGGRASQLQIRAVVAWSMLPEIVAAALWVGVLVWARYVAGTPVPPTLAATLKVITGLLALWGFVLLLLMFARAQGFGFWRTVGSAAVYLLLTLTPLLFRALVFQPFSIPSQAQMPTLLVGDYLFVGKYAYGYSAYSLPVPAPFLTGRLLAVEPQRGDTVAFRLPKDDSVDFIKRVVGLPGDRIQMRNGALYINGAAVKRERIDDFVYEEDGRTVRAKRWRETLPNGVSYETLDLQDDGFLDNTQEYVVPPGHYFMLGDNRDNSTDSRVLSQVSYVPIENIVGRAGMVYFSINRESKPGEAHLRLNRLGLIVR